MTLSSVFRAAAAVVILSGSAHAAPVAVLVNPFTNAGDPKFSWVGAGMTSSLVSDLSRAGGVTVVSEEERKKALDEMELAMAGLVGSEKTVRTGKLLGADFILSGSYQVAGTRIRINAVLTGVERAAVVSSIKFDGELADIFTLQDRIAVELMSEAAKSSASGRAFVFTDEDRRRMTGGIKPSLSAYESHSRGLEIRYTNPRGDLEYQRQAVKLQPDYIEAMREAAYIASTSLSLFDEALGFVTKAESVLTKRGEAGSVVHAHILMTKGVVLRSRGDGLGAIAAYDASRKLMDKFSLSGTADYSDLMANIAIAHLAKGDAARAVEFNLKAKDIRDSLGHQNTALYSSILNNTGTAYWHEEEIDRAYDFFMRAKELKEKLGLVRTAGYAEVMNNLGLVCDRRRDFDRALEFYLKDKEIEDALSLQSTEGYGVLMMNIGIIRFRKGELQSSLDAYTDAKNIFDRLKLGNSSNYAALMLNTGNVMWQKGDLSGALVYFNASKEIREKLGLRKTTGYGSLMYNIALTYEKLGKPEAAGESFRKAYEAYSASGFKGDVKDDARRRAEQYGK